MHSKTYPFEDEYFFRRVGVVALGHLAEKGFINTALVLLKREVI